MRRAGCASYFSLRVALAALLAGGGLAFDGSPAIGLPRAFPRKAASPHPMMMVARAVDAVVNEESLQWYLSSIGEHDLLSLDDEQHLSTDVQELVRWQSVRDQLKQQLNRQPTQGEWSQAVCERGLLAACDAGFADGARKFAQSQLTDDETCFDSQLQRLRRAKERMINANLRLVVSISKRYANRGLALQDLIQEGTLGLIAAVDKYDPQHQSKAKFSSYASWWIKQRVSRAVSKAGTIRLPSRMPSLIYSVQKSKDDFVLALGREPSHEELASAVGISVNRLKVVLSTSRDLSPVSLDREVSSGMENDRRTLADTIPDAAPTPEHHIESRLMRQTLARTLHQVLDAEEHAVICACYDLIEDRGRGLTYEEMSVRFGHSAEWVEQVESRAMKKLRGKSGVAAQLRNLLATRNLRASDF